MKLSPLVVQGKHDMDGLPPGVTFDGRTRELVFEEGVPPGRFAATYVGRGDGVEVAVQVHVGAEQTPD